MALTTAFAKNGNKKAVPQTTQDGSVSYDQGFGNLYALPPEEGGLFIDRAQFNQIMYDTTSAVISNQSSINTLNSKVTANQNSINTLNSKVADLESGVSTGVVNLTGNQTIAGIKTFSSPPVSATNPTANNQLANKAYVDSVGNTAVKLTGNQTIAGTKTFSSPVVVPDATANTHAVNLAQLNTKANANATVNLTGNQTIAGIKTFSAVPVCATNPTANNQIANKAYVDAIAATKAGYVTKTLTIGSGGDLANLNEFRLYTIRNFAHYYILSLLSNVEETEALNFSGVSFGFNNNNYTITFKKNASFLYGNIYFGNIGLKIDTQLDESIVFSNCNLYINGNLNFTDTFNSAASLSTGKLGGIVLNNTNAYFGDSDSWNITTAKRHFIAILGSRVQVGNVTFNGNLTSGKELFHFARQGILMTQNSTFNNLTVTGIAQNAITNKGLWIKE